MKRILDEPTYARVSDVIAAAQANGRDLPEALHSAGMLLTPDVDRSVRIEALTAFREDFRRWRPAEYLRRVRVANATPADMHRAISEYLDDYIQATQRGD